MQLNSYSNYHANTFRPSLHPRIQVESIQSISSTTHRLTPRFHAYAHMQALTINKRKKIRKKAQKVWVVIGYIESKIVRLKKGQVV